MQFQYSQAGLIKGISVSTTIHLAVLGTVSIATVIIGTTLSHQTVQPDSTVHSKHIFPKTGLITQEK